MDYRIKRQIGAWVGGAILALVIVLAARDAHAVDIRPRAAPAQLLAQFDTVSDACLSAPLTAGGKYSPKCVERDRIARALERAGYERSRHDVWFRSSDVGTVFRIAAIAATIPPSQYIDQRAQMRAMCNIAGIDDAELFAIWQEHAAELRDSAPRAWAVASELLQHLYFSGAVDKRDPRFMLD